MATTPASPIIGGTFTVSGDSQKLKQLKELAYRVLRAKGDERAVAETAMEDYLRELDKMNFTWDKTVYTTGTTWSGTATWTAAPFTITNGTITLSTSGA